jgi:hypothetical protein
VRLTRLNPEGPCKKLLSVRLVIPKNLNKYYMKAQDPYNLGLDVVHVTAVPPSLLLLLVPPTWL